MYKPRKKGYKPREFGYKSRKFWHFPTKTTYENEDEHMEQLKQIFSTTKKTVILISMATYWISIKTFEALELFIQNIISLKKDLSEVKGLRNDRTE